MKFSIVAVMALVSMSVNALPNEKSAAEVKKLFERGPLPGYQCSGPVDTEACVNDCKCYCNSSNQKQCTASGTTCPIGGAYDQCTSGYCTCQL